MCFDPFRTENPLVNEIKDTEERLIMLKMQLAEQQKNCPKHKWSVKYTPYDDGIPPSIDVPQWTRVCKHCHKTEITELWHWEKEKKGKKPENRIPEWWD